MLEKSFKLRHIGPRDTDVKAMLSVVNASTLDELIEQTVPTSIRLKKPMQLEKALSEYEYIKRIKEIASKNQLFSSYIGKGYYETILPAVIQRNVLENPSWYTSYTPYQAEISQGRLEALLNFQTAVIELTGMEIANASLLDEATAAGEAMIMLYNSRSRDKVKNEANVFLVDDNMFEQSLAILEAKAEPLGIIVKKRSFRSFSFLDDVFGCMVQYPAGDGKIIDHSHLVKAASEKEIPVVVIADLLSLALLIPPGEWGADVVVGSTQRFGIPMGYGGPHAGYFATRDKYKRNAPGRIIGISKDSNGNRALRMALQTREQHIKRERATSNICTAQALLASMAGFYCVYHGADGLKEIASHIHTMACIISDEAKNIGYSQLNPDFFDTLLLKLPANASMPILKQLAIQSKINLNYIDDKHVGISVDETKSPNDINNLLTVLAKAIKSNFSKVSESSKEVMIPTHLRRKSNFLNHDVFNSYHSETEMMRYIKKLERRDISLTHSMISLGSCTMKLNAATEMLPLSWPEFGSMHPFAPVEQAEGYHTLFRELENDLCEITGFDRISLQPNSGASGEYAGLMVIRAYHKSRGDRHRNVVLIPASAHGTNPASAVMAGLKVIVVSCDEKGNINVGDLKEKAITHKDNLCCFMVTYPSTHGVFEEAIIDMNKIIHDNGGQVYMDGANMNAQVGLTNPRTIGADVCHLNLHKTFAIPHGGGGPGVGPIGVSAHLAPFLPNHPVVRTGGEYGQPIAAAPWGSAGILCISHAYIKMLGAEGLTYATKMAILNANYLASSLKKHYNILYTGKNNRVAHEMILDCREFKSKSGITESDIAKRLMDYGFHAPTLSFPVHGTLMIEPTESESLSELNRFIGAMEAIFREMEAIENGQADKEDNMLRNAPHTCEVVTADKWEHAYSREDATYPLPWIRENKFFPFVGRIDDAYGDRNLICRCS